MESKQTDESSYVIDSSSGAEMARLIDQDSVFTQATGVFPSPLDLTEVYHILDVACGPGGWARKAAHQLPDTTVVGIDINTEMIDYANAFAKVQQLQNLSFQVMNITQPLAFADASFDLVNARLLIAVIYKHVWPVLLQELARVTRPNGWILLTESDKLFTTNSQAEETILGMGLKAMVRAGFYAGHDGDGLEPQLASLLTNAGLTDIHTEHHVIDISSGTPAHSAILSNLKIAFVLIQPFLLKMGYSSQQELTTLYEQAITDVESNDFRGQVDLTRTWCRKR